MAPFYSLLFGNKKWANILTTAEWKFYFMRDNKVKLKKMLLNY